MSRANRRIHGLLYPGFGPLVRGRLFGPSKSAGGLVLIDTGASMSAVDRDLARDLALPTHGAAIWQAVGGEQQAVAAVRTAQLAIGEDARHWELDLLEAPNLRSRIQGYTLVALLGWDFLDQCRIEVDGPGGTFRLELPRG